MIFAIDMFNLEKKQPLLFECFGPSKNIFLRSAWYKWLFTQKHQPGLVGVEHPSPGSMGLENGYLQFILSFQASYLVGPDQTISHDLPKLNFSGKEFVEIVVKLLSLSGQSIFLKSNDFRDQSFHPNIECLFWFMCCTSSHWRTWTSFSRWQ